MKKLLALAVLTLPLLAGCTNLDPFVLAVDASWKVIGPEYTLYVDQDPRLDDASKLARKRTATMFSALIDQAKASLAAQDGAQ